ncbi:MAG: ABC transporter permease subunit [Desulfobacterales bacterium]|nr:MAG: ABC transporter permease subunit [Desulfobacterales bacterium]
MLPKRISQFLIIYFLGLGLLLAVKYGFALSDYVIPGIADMQNTAAAVAAGYLRAVLDTLGVAVIGHLLAIALATVVAIVGRRDNLLGTMIKTAAYNLQAYPIVAVAPIIFILLGDGLPSRLLIAAIICYFPLLLSFIGIMSEPVASIEHFYVITGRMRWQLEVKIRAFEIIHKLITVVTGSATLAMVGTIVAEFIGADSGIGYSLRIALYQSDIAKVLVALFLIGVFNSLYLVALELLGLVIQKRMGVEQRMQQ